MVVDDLVVLLVVRNVQIVALEFSADPKRSCHQKVLEKYLIPEKSIRKIKKKIKKCYDNLSKCCCVRPVA